MLHYIEIIYLLSLLIFLLILPGYFIFFRIKENRKLYYPLVPVVSIAINGFLLWILYLAGIYTKISVAILYFGYIALFILYIKRQRNQNDGNPISQDIEFEISNKKTFILFFVGLFCVYYALSSFTTIFTEWDAVTSWNYWARLFAHNRFNVFQGYSVSYPQLMPLIFSVFYKMNFFNSGFHLNNAEFICHLLSFLFTLFTIYSLFYYSLIKDIPPVLPILLLLSNNLYIYWNSSGYCDVFPGIFVISYFYLTDLSKKLCKKNDFLYFLLLSLIAAAAGFSKGSGLIITLLGMGFIIYNFIKEYHFSPKMLFRLFAILIPIFITFSFYLYGTTINKNSSLRWKSDQKYLMSLNNYDRYNVLYHKYTGDDGKNINRADLSYFLKMKLNYYSYISYFIPGGGFLKSTKNNLLVIVFELLFFLSLISCLFKKDEFLKGMTIFMFFALWVYFYGYDLRHVLPMHALMALLAAMFIKSLLRTKIVTNALIYLLLLLFVANNTNIFDVSFLVKRFDEFKVFKSEPIERLKETLPDYYVFIKLYEFVLKDKNTKCSLYTCHVELPGLFAFYDLDTNTVDWQNENSINNFKEFLENIGNNNYFADLNGNYKDSISNNKQFKFIRNIYNYRLYKKTA